MDIANDEEARAAFYALGADSVPIVARGGRFIPGIDLGLVAEFLQLSYDPEPALPVDVLIARLGHTLATATRLTAQIPSTNLLDKLPNRDRTLLSLANHIAQIAGGFIKLAAGREYTRSAISGNELDRDALAERSHAVETELSGLVVNPSSRVATYYGTSTLHGVLERCAWHAAQHTRQLAMVLEGLGIEPDEPLGSDDLAGLPLPEEVWDD